jgi:hypothetical protein
MRRYPTFLLLVVSLAVTVPPAFASKGGNGGGGNLSSPNIAIATLNGTAMNASTTSLAPAYQDTVTWTTTTGSLAGWESPRVVLSCYQDVNGDGVVDTTMGSRDIVYSWVDSPGAAFSFSGQGQTSIWSLRGGGAATCRADLDAYGVKGGQESVRVLATTKDFAVAG